MAHSSQYAFVSISGAELYSSFVGEAERNLRDVFARARASTPAIVFLDELDSMVRSRESKSSAVEDRILATLLNEMDGIQAASGIWIMGATNRVDELDAALLRPGRFDQVIEVPLPDLEARLSILRLGPPVGSAVDLEATARVLEGCSGAEVEAVLREAGLAAIRGNSDRIEQQHVDQALLSARRQHHHES